jgi:hypothetical protein
MFRSFLIKLAIIPLLILSAIILAALYGALHNQISFTISNEYFTNNKFIQFGIENIQPRIGASLVGILATWWMGIIIGLPLSLVALIYKKPKDMLFSTYKAYLVIIITVVIAGISGIIYGIISISNEQPASSYYFTLAGTMHNFSYLGGLLGILAGIVFQIIYKLKYSK